MTLEDELKSLESAISALTRAFEKSRSSTPEFHDPLPDAEIPVVMSPQQLADLCSVSVKTVERWREAHEGPQPFKLPGGRMWRYHRDEVIEWMATLRE